MKVNEIFYSLQGEGHYTGVPAVFVRFSGCNLRCPFCDTDHSAYVEMTEQQIVDAAAKFPARHVVLTGGEPAMQVSALLTDLLHSCGFYVQIETNGTVKLADGVLVDWITCSPKAPGSVRLEHVDEVKALYDSGVSGSDGVESTIAGYAQIPAQEYRLQPCDVGDAARNSANLKGAIAYCLAHPQWRLSLQTHKILGLR